ncbi:M12 family metallo-peptidase [Microbulbifer sp. SSSA002]|uniref:M12 family metallo-peptidase n=1 Tax=Microbulbifer sp. SSSA002 TaxID=3243376 RepID=UPI00403A2A9F
MKSFKLLVPFVLLFTALNASSKEESHAIFFEPAKVETKKLLASRVLKRKFNREILRLKPGSTLEVPGQGKKQKFILQNIRSRQNETSLSAFSEDGNSFVTLAENNGKIVGSIQSEGRLYKVRPAGHGEVTISEVPSSSLIDHDDGYFEDVSSTLNARTLDTTSVDTVSDSGGKITVIVTYTEAFETDAGDVSAYMDLLEEETNVSFVNSDIDTSVEIVHAYKTSYTESGSFYTDREYFSNSEYPETQELYELRDLYSADVMMVLTGNELYSGSCGLAKAIYASESTALAFAREGCATGYFSFAHEIGHLLGARHIIYSDSSTTPFRYGHGYCNTTASTWRTVMAYNCPSNRGGPRIQQWSNPDITIDGDPTGTTYLEDNARVIRERAWDVANFRVDGES